MEFYIFTFRTEWNDIMDNIYLHQHRTKRDNDFVTFIDGNNRNNNTEEYKEHNYHVVNNKKTIVNNNKQLFQWWS